MNPSSHSPQYCSQKTQQNGSAHISCGNSAKLGGGGGDVLDRRIGSWKPGLHGLPPHLGMEGDRGIQLLQPETISKKAIFFKSLYFNRPCKLTGNMIISGY